MKITKALKDLGLSEKQAVVYKACLELGNSGAQRIADKADLPKSSVYDVLSDLTHQGLISINFKKNKKQFVPSDPLLFQDKAKRQEKIANQFMPELQALYNSISSKPKVRFYEGKPGVQIVLKEILKEAQYLECFASAEDIFTTLKDYFPDFSHQRAKKKIPLRVILRDSKKAHEREKSAHQELRQVKIVKTQIPFNSLIYIWQNKIAMVTLKEDIVIVILESHELAQTFGAWFELVWGE